MTSNDLRQKFLDFFKRRGHAPIPSAPLVPADDPTTLFTSSGMQPFVPFLLGKPHPQGNRLVDSQKSFRAQDIEVVGDNRHTTFFEMLGNWSLGDYFKEEQIPWIFEFVTRELGLDPRRLYFTCFRGNETLNLPRDEESANLWHALLVEEGIDAKIVDLSELNGFQGGRIFYYDETNNWWSRFGAPEAMPVGEPGGPDSEIFWDFGAHWKLHEQSLYRNQPCHVNCECGRFIEIGNNVFMEYVKQEEGFEKLAQKNVDFGGGLERMMAAVGDNPDVFLIDLFSDTRRSLEALSGEKYGKGAEETRAFRVILDHMRASTFLIAEGVRPSNIERGYVLRRLLRRSARYARLLQLPLGWYDQVIQSVIRTYHDIYPEVILREEICMVIATEYEKFEKALERGLRAFEKLVARGEISGEDAFHIYQSYGFPIEMIEELARDGKVRVDRLGFDEAFKEHQIISRRGQEKKFGGHGLMDVSLEETRNNPEAWRKVRLHTATHLLHGALRTVLGPSVRQMGSDITPERTRFDFRYPRKVTDEELHRVEETVNQKIREDLEVRKETMPYEEAIAAGALAFFKEKYPDIVTVYSIGDYSRELCGGPHVSRTSEIGRFRIVKEEAVAASIRRVRATVEP